MKIKAHIISIENKKSKSIKKFLEKKIIFSNVKNSDYIIVLGGDGFMLETLKKFYRYNKPFYGINCGNYGFLMNKFNHKNTILKLSQATKVIISPLEMIVNTKNKLKKKAIAINEISILRQSRQAASLHVKSGKKEIIKKLISDGILVSTPAGSTAYNLSVYGPILSLICCMIKIAVYKKRLRLKN